MREVSATFCKWNIFFFFKKRTNNWSEDISSKASFETFPSINRSNRGEFMVRRKGYVLIQQFGRKKWRRSVGASKQREHQITINFTGLQITINFARKVRRTVSLKWQRQTNTGGGPGRRETEIWDRRLPKGDGNKRLDGWWRWLRWARFVFARFLFHARNRAIHISFRRHRCVGPRETSLERALNRFCIKEIFALLLVRRMGNFSSKGRRGGHQISKRRDLYHRRDRCSSTFRIERVVARQGVV